MDLRLALVTTSLRARSGADRVILRIARHFDATIFCPSYDPDNIYPEFSKVNFETAKPGLSTNIPIARSVFDVIDNSRYFLDLKIKGFDVINPHVPPSEWVRRNNSPVLWYCYSPYRFAFDLRDWKMARMNLAGKVMLGSWVEVFKRIEFGIIPKIEYLFTTSEECRLRIKKYLKRESEVLYPGIDSERFSNRGQENFFLLPSRFEPEKELEFAIDAFTLFKKRTESPGQHAGSRWRLVLAGGTMDLELPQRYLKKIRALAEEANSRFGHKAITIETDITDERMADLYSRCHCTVFSPPFEDFGLVPLEGMASGKPCIGRDSAGPRETIIDGEDGFLVNSVEGMADKMALLAADPEKAAAMGRSGRAKVVKKFTWKRFLDRFEEKAREMVAR